MSDDAAAFRFPGIPALLRYLHKHGLSVSAFAKKHDFDVSYLSRLLSGQKLRVTVALAAKIEDATESEVQIRMWITTEGSK